MKLYSDLAEYYYAIESHHRNISDDISFIRSYMPKDVKIPSLLDLGCGSGEHLAMLNRTGVKCTGLDVSKDIIEVARKRNGNSIRYLISDMREFDFFEEFDVITSLFGSFDYMVDDRDVEKVLWNTRRALKTGGIAIFEIWNSTPVVKISEKPISFVSETRIPEGTIRRERGFSVISIHPATVVRVDYRYYIQTKGGVDFLEDSHVMRSYRIDEFEKVLNANGLKILALYTNTLKERYHLNSNKIIVVFTRE